MTEQQVIALQAQSGRSYLLQVGLFVHAYEGAAFAMARLTGYKVRRVHRRKGDVVLLGFSSRQLDAVCQRLREAGIEVSQEAEGLWAFEGGDTTADERLVSAVATDKPATAAPVEPMTPAPADAATPAERMLAAEVLGYNLATSTPMAALLFLSDLQQRYGKK
jgi:hypothetical protein